MKDIGYIWGRAIQIVKEEVSEVSFRTWIEPIRPVQITESVCVFSVPYTVTKDMIFSKYAPLIKSALAESSGFSYDIEVVVDDELPRQGIDGNIGLNPRYTFESFVVGSNNNLANAAAMAIAESASSNWNPLFLYGSSGLGKTHLLHAIANHVIHHDRARKVLFCTSEGFLNDLVQAIQTGTNPAFREKYRRSDIFLVDDIQFIAGKDSMQEEFHHTFNALFDNGKQIVLTSDRLPSEIPRLTERLQTRFQGGLIVDIQPPDFEMRLAILRNKLQSACISVEDDITSYVAEKIRSNVRDLEGAVQRMLAYAKIERSNKVTMTLAERALKEILDLRKQKQITVSVVIEEVEKYYNLPKGSLKSQKRSQDVAFPRHIAMYIARETVDISFPQIGKDFGGRDHTTVMASVRRIKKEMDGTPGLKESIEDIVCNMYKN